MDKKDYEQYQNVSGLYVISNIENDRFYFGSSINMYKRINEHLNQLRGQKHSNLAMQRDFNRYGESPLRVKCYPCDIDLASKTEIVLIQDLPQSYNVQEAVNYNIELSLEQIQYFWSRYNCENSDSCWEHKTTISKTYQATYFNGQPYLSHRLAYRLHYGNLPANAVVCHSCDNKKCINPKHLFLGSSSDNHRDRANKGIGHCNLDLEKANFIREYFLANKSSKKELFIMIKEKYGLDMSRHTLERLLANKTYKSDLFPSMRTS